MSMFNWVKHQPIRIKLISAFTLILLMLGAVSGTQMFIFNKFMDQYNDMLLSTEQANRLIGLLKTDFDPEIEKIVNGRQSFEESGHHRILDRLQTELSAVERNENATEMKAEFRTIHNTIASIHAQLNNLNDQIVHKATVDERIASYETIVQTTGMIEEQLQQLVRVKLHENAAEKEMISRQFNQNVFLYTAAFIAVTAISLLVAWLIAREIAVPIRKLSISVSQMAQGNLSAQPVYARSRDEIGKLCESFNTMFGTLREIIGGIRDTNEQVAVSTVQMDTGLYENKQAGEDIAAASQNVALALSEHDEYIQLSVRELDRLVQLFRTLADNSRHINHQVFESLQAAEQGKRQIESFMLQFANLTAALTQVDLDAKQLQQLFQEMDHMLKLIRSISGETNILALNASIEANRASVHGQGFGVIAGRVKQLANQTTSLSSHIDDKMEHVRQSVRVIEHRMQESMHRLRTGEQAAVSAAMGYQSIHASYMAVQTEIDTITKEIGIGGERLAHIYQLVKEVKLRAERIKRDMDEIAAMEQEQVASLIQISGSSGILAKQISELNHKVLLFRD